MDHLKTLRNLEKSPRKPREPKKLQESYGTKRFLGPSIYYVIKTFVFLDAAPPDYVMHGWSIRKPGKFKKVPRMKFFS